MCNAVMKKLFLIVLAVTLVLALLTLLLPVDSVDLGYYNQNGASGTTTAPKIQGILILSGMPLYTFLLWRFNTWRMETMPEAKKVKRKAWNYLYLALSPIGAVMLLVNLVKYCI